VALQSSILSAHRYYEFSLAQMSRPQDPFQQQGANYPYHNQPQGPGGLAAPPLPANPQQGGYYDADPEMKERYEGGGMGRETWASESGWSGDCKYTPMSVSIFMRSSSLNIRLYRLTARPSSWVLPFSVEYPHSHRREHRWPPRERALCETHVDIRLRRFLTGPTLEARLDPRS
jgi:hypothetical protein